MHPAQHRHAHHRTHHRPTHCRRARCVLQALIGLLWATLPAHAAFIVRGTITDSAGNPLPRIEVEIIDEDDFDNDELGTTFTDGAGRYAFGVTSGFGPEDPDIFIRVRWAFELIPPPGGSFGGHQMQLLGTTSMGDCGRDQGLVSFTRKDSPTRNNYNSTDDLVINLRMNHAVANVGRLRSDIDLAVDFFESNKGTVAWNLDADILVKVRLGGNRPEGSCYNQNNRTVYISNLDIAATPGTFGRRSDIYHEIGHRIHHGFVSGGLPPLGGFTAPHADTTESNPSFALVEAWPSYTAELTDNGTGGAGDSKYATYRDMNRTHWRGDELPGTGLDGALFESGEHVEGALGGFWFAIHNDPRFNFSDNFRVFVNDNPQNVFEFCEEFVEDMGGPGTANTLAMYGHMQAHGIVYNRAQLATVPFLVSDPPDKAPESAGNKKEINGRLFLRGTVRIKFESVTARDLGVNRTVANRRVKIFVKPANPGVNDGTGAFSRMTGLVSFPTAELNTRTFDNANGDGDWDLLIVAENKDEFVDNLLPTWVGDSNAAVDTDEKYLKVLGAWYDKDRDPSTNQDDEGMVIVDNAQPDVSNFKPQ